MIHLIKGILTNEECINLTKQFDIEKKISTNADEQSAYTNATGFSPSYVFNTYLDKLKTKVLEFNSNIDDLTNVNTYVREYLNKSILRKHIDRPDISVTMSICLESTIDTEWPLCAKINNQEYCFNITTGDGIILFDADKTPHWRDMLVCNENERVVQFFLHWVPVDYTTKKIKSLI